MHRIVTRAVCPPVCGDAEMYTAAQVLCRRISRGVSVKVRLYGFISVEHPLDDAYSSLSAAVPEKTGGAENDPLYVDLIGIKQQPNEALNVVPLRPGKKSRIYVCQNDIAAFFRSALPLTRKRIMTYFDQQPYTNCILANISDNVNLAST